MLNREPSLYPPEGDPRIERDYEMLEQYREFENILKDEQGDFIEVVKQFPNINQSLVEAVASVYDEKIEKNRELIEDLEIRLWERGYSPRS